MSRPSWASRPAGCPIASPHAKKNSKQEVGRKNLLEKLCAISTTEAMKKRNRTVFFF
jgi:hypothetical protein